MNLWSPLGKLQKNGAEFYLKLAERFQENTVIRETWTAMAQDLDAQAASLRALHHSFWKLLEKEEKELLEAIAAGPSMGPLRTLDPVEWTLHRCFERTLDFEEHASLKVYAPVIYYLRRQSGRALDFYVMVHAHLTRLARLIQPFSGDPALIQRCLILLEQFEKEAQAGLRPEPVVTASRKSRTQTAARAHKTGSPARDLERPAARKQATQKRSSGRSVGRRAVVRAAARKSPRHKLAAKRSHKPAKRIVKDIKLSRRARR